MLSRPAGLSDDALRRALATNWDLVVVTLRYRHALFDRDAAARFLLDFKSSLIDG